MSNQNRILVLVGLAFLILYVTQVTVFPLRLPNLELKPAPLWNAIIGVFLIVLGGFGIETAKRLFLTFGKVRVGIETERYEPTPQEERQIVYYSSGELTADQISHAATLREKAEERTPEQRSAADLLVLVTDAWRSKDFESAINLAYQGLTLSPTKRVRATLRKKLGASYKEVGAQDLAEKMFRLAIADDSSFSWPHTSLGILLEETGRTEEAEKEFQKATELDPPDKEAHTSLGNLLKKTGRTEEAEKEFQKATELQPST